MLIAATLYICYFSNLNAIGFVGPDEPRYAWIARDMAETGDWVTPRLYGRPWFEKPPLLYWGGAICFKIMPSQPEIAARLPSAICALLATLALAWLAWRTHGEECARWLLLLLPTSVGMIAFSHACATDMPFAGMLTAALVCAAVILGLVPPNEDTPVLPRTPWLALLLLGFFLGLAVLAKGPAALILTGGAVFFWALFTKRWRDAFHLLHPAAIAMFCLTALPWYILCARRNPDFFRVFIIEHNFKRYLTPEFQHIQPFWFYIPVVLIAFLPWTAGLIYWLAAGPAILLKRRAASSMIVFLLSWSLLPLIFFSISRSKLPGYILPAVPSIALLLAHSITRYAVERRKSLGATFLVFAIMMGVTAGIIDHSRHNLPLEAQFHWLFAMFFLYMIALANGVLAGGFLCSDKRWAKDVALILGLLLMQFSLAVLQSERNSFLLSGLSTDQLATHLRHHGVRVEDIYLDRDVSRSPKYSLSFYLRREVGNWDQNPERSVYVLSKERNCTQLRNLGFSCRDIPLGSEVHDWFVTKIVAPSDSLTGLGSGRKPQ